jgi:hypothetical protein
LPTNPGMALSILRHSQLLQITPPDLVQGISSDSETPAPRADL